MREFYGVTKMTYHIVGDEHDYVYDDDEELILKN